MTDTPPPGTPRGRSASGRGLRIALAISVALNLAIVGIVGGAWLKLGGGPRVPVRELGFGPFTEALTRDQRAELRRTFLRQGPALRDLRRDMREDADDILSALRAIPFAPEVFAARLGRMNERLAGRTQEGEGVLVHVVTTMSPVDRAAFADRLQAEMERGPRAPHKGDRPVPSADQAPPKN